MKTRRILAASTAALLAMGSVAVVASAAGEKATVTAAAATNGTVTLKVDGTAVTAGTDYAGQVVTIDAEPDSGYEVDTITVTDGDDNEITVSNSRFTMPAIDSDDPANITVTVTVTFKETAKHMFESAVPSVTVLEDFSGMDADEMYEIGGDVQVSASEKALEKIENYSIGAANSVKTTVGTCFTASGNSIASKSGIFAMTDKKYNTALKKAIDVKSGDVKNANKTMQVFNISLGYGADAGNETFNKDITLGAKVLVKIKSSVNGKLYHLSNDGKTLEKVDAAVSKGINDDAGYWFYTFETNKFSPFVVADISIDGLTTLGTQAGDFAEDPDASEANSGTSAATSNGGTTTNPNTGIALAIAPVVLAAGAVAVVALKKKH